MNKELDKIYNPKEVEDKTYDFWMENDYFKGVVDKSKTPYTIVIPPPNITGQLHIGHALDNTLQDVLIRWKRMSGYAALWVPGTDHASIATEAKIVATLKEQGISKDDLTREEFLKMAWEWKDKYGGTIINQLKKLGSSCDWSRTRFTLDEGCSEAVKEVFVNLYNKGLIYRGERIINWCPTCLTSISNAEVEHEEKNGNFWHIRYKIVGEEGYLELATTRPETMLGDTAVAVNPDDERYASLIGKNVILPLVEKEIKIIADSYVDPEFGTGVVKITPAHDPNDFEVGLRHNLEILNIMDEAGVINKAGGKYAGMDRYEARKRVVADLEAAGNLVKVEPHAHNVGTCYRCSTIVEPRVSNQWFVKMEPLAKPAIKAVKEGETKFVPEHFDKTYFHWMENIRDWCISRQLWWGHRIPAYYCDDCREITVSKDEVTKCSSCSSTNVRQDNDTLDTWFSSALWPFSTLGWPEKTEDLDFFFPTNTLVTGYDIIFFWVARMIFSSVEHMGEVPFETVYIHGMIRDAQGRKMSKSLGNGVDPLEIISEYGADALRYTLIHGSSPGNDIHFSDEKILSARNFCNKMWNAARFIMMNLPKGVDGEKLPGTLETEDKWLLSKYNRLIKEVKDNLDKYELSIALTKINSFFWDVYCDWYIELAKSRMNDDQQSFKVNQVLVYVMSGTLKLLHPFMPFITEEIWQALPHSGDSIMISDYPVYSSDLEFLSDEQDFEKVVELIKEIRNSRQAMDVPPSKKSKLHIETDDTAVFKAGIPFIMRLASASEVTVSGSHTESEKSVIIITSAARGFIPMDQLVDKEKELARLEKEKENVLKDIKVIGGKLGNEGFVAKAPEKVVALEKEKFAAANERLAKIEESLKELN